MRRRNAVVRRRGSSHTQASGFAHLRLHTVRRRADGNLAAGALNDARTEESVMGMVALFSNAAFDSETTELLGAAFEAAWEKLNAAGSALAEGSEAALTRDCWRNALSRWRSGARETPIAWSRTLWIIWR